MPDLFAGDYASIRRLAPTFPRLSLLRWGAKIKRLLEEKTG